MENNFPMQNRFLNGIFLQEGGEVRLLYGIKLNKVSMSEAISTETNCFCPAPFDVRAEKQRWSGRKRFVHG
jgi:hypothetical protein